ncbi:MAG TPA: PepSY domain-containing protein [Burkholderiaceae bacterium]|nr:PepSY domain-containing protein [Burkholderiaceae bacterium]
MSFKPSMLFAAVAVAVSAPASATGHCPVKDAGPRAEWQSKESLEKKLVDAGWKVRRVKVDEQCYEVYGTDAKGQRVEAYFHPKTLEPAKP